MTPSRTLLAALFLFCFASFYTTSAFAFCGTIRATADALSDQDALKSANNVGLAKVRQLDAQYGSRVKYQPAKSNCVPTSGGNRSQCTITQTYCVADARPSWPKCGKNEVVASNDAGCRCKPGFEKFMGACEPHSISRPWTTPLCKSTKLACSNGSQKACNQIESRCNPN